MHVRWLRLSSVLAIISAMACDSSGGMPPPSPPPGGSPGALVVGVQLDPFGSLVSSVHVRVRRAGQIVTEDTTPFTGANLSREIVVDGAIGANVEVFAEAFGAAAGSAPIVSRTAITQLVPSTQKKLLRVQLEGRCAIIPNTPPELAPVCNAPMTCIAGSCQSADVAPASLEDYEPTWPQAPPDICRPARRGPPEVRIGVGQTDYTILEDNQVQQLEKGPQGGHHVWIAARMRNLRQSGSTTTITSRIVDDPEPVPPASFVFTFERDEGGYCKLWGLRYQVDAGAKDLSQAYKRFLGKRLEVTVEVRDSTGASAASTKVIQLGEKLLCPDGTDRCT